MDPEQIFVDSTHAKACATSKKMRKQVAHEQALWYEQELKEEIQKDRTAHGKRPLKVLQKIQNHRFWKEQKYKSAASAIRKEVGFIKGNINMFLHMQ